MSERDYYETLGVARGATADEIRAAYRKLARRYHPDVSKDADAAERFNEVQEAYEVLSDPAKRHRYDQFGRAGAGAGAAGGPGGRGQHYSWSNVGGSGGGGAGDFAFDQEDLGSMFEAFFGGRGRAAGASPGPATSQAGARRKQRPLEHEITITFETAARGGRETIRLSAAGEEKTIDVTIPQGVADGARLRIRDALGGRDLLLTIRVGRHPIFRRERGPDGSATLDLSLDLPLTIAEATLGARIRVPTLEGPVELTVPAGVSGGQRLRLRGKGLRDAAGKTGDLHAIARIAPPDPEKLNEQQRQMLRELAEATPPVRTGPHWTG